MLITVHCPKCRARYQLQPELRGQKMRCPNAVCREVFEVHGDGEQAAQPTDEPAAGVKESAKLSPAVPPPAYKAGYVGEMVPLVTAEAAEEVAEPQDIVLQPENVPADASATAPPPVRRPPLTTPEPTVPPPVRQLAAKAPATPPPKPTTRPSEAKKAPPPPVEVVPATLESPPAPPEPPPVRPRGKAPSIPPVPVKPEPPREPEKPPTPLVEIVPATLETPPVAEPPPVRARGKEPTETAKPKPEPAPEPPPVRARAKDTIPPLKTAPEPASASWDLPPVRRKAADTGEMPAPAADWPAASAPTPPVSEPAPPPVKKGRGTLWIILTLLLVSGAALAGVLWYGGALGQQTEEDRDKTAYAAFTAGEYQKARGLFETMLKDFPESARLPRYRFLADYSRVRGQVQFLGVAPEAGLEDLRTFVGKHGGSPFFAEFKESDVRADFIKLAEKFLARAQQVSPVEEEANLKKIKPDLALADEQVAEARKLAPSVAPPAELTKGIAALQKSVLEAEEVLNVVDRLRTTEATPENINQVKQLFREAGKDKLLDHPKVKAEFQRLEGEAVKNVRYFALNKPASIGAPPEESPPGLLVVPRLDAGKKPAAGGKDVIFALARGVLYALAEDDGRVRWATRVGIDTAVLPVRLPATQVNPVESVLVLSSDSNTLCARNAFTGEGLWHHRLPAPCLGRPLVVHDPERRLHRAYVPLTDGRIFEIEVASGFLVSEYRLGMPLRVGGARQEGTSLLYFPGDFGYVFVIDYLKQQCVGLLNSGHPAGSLRGEPIVAGGDLPNNPNRFLILAQSQGLDAMKLRAFRLPIEPNTAVLMEESVPGWSWFPPFCDGEKVVLATDAGVLGLYGVNQFRNQDPPLFPLIGRDDLRLPGSLSGRAQVVHAAENDFWVLGRGTLQHWRVGLGQKGMTAAPVWKDPPLLGTPLHSGQVSARRDAVYAVTQSPDGRACLATAVDASSGKVRWQRQLGWVSQGEPVLLGERVLTEDQAGGLFAFDPARFPKQADREWELSEQALAQPLAQGGGDFVLATAGGGAVYLIRSTGKELLIRRCAAGKKPEETDVSQLTFPAALGGTPALGPGYLVLPLADGILLRQPLTKGAAGDLGPHWRAIDAEAGARGHVVHLGGHDFAVTDGVRGLRRVSWPEPKKWTLHKEVMLPERITAIAAVPADDAKAPARLCVADSAGTVRLVRLTGDELEELGRWDLKGAITAGPFLRGKQIGCVVDGKRLVWLQPGAAPPLWSWTPEAEAGFGQPGIVGRPHLAGEVLVVADTSGRLTFLDPQTGRPRGPAFRVKASVAPAAAPVPFGPGRVFLPLTDGTALLLPLFPQP